MLFTVAAAGLSPRSEDRDEARSTHQLPPTRSISTQTRQQFQSRKRPYEENRGRGYFEHREDRRGRSPQPPAEEDEDDFDDTLVAIDTYNCDLHFKVAWDRSSGYPLTIEGFAYLWSEARASYGVRRGRVCFEMKINEEISVKHLPSTEPDPHVVRIGWSLDSCSTQLSKEPFSCGHWGTGKKSTNSRFENYGDRFAENDVIGCFAWLRGQSVCLQCTRPGFDPWVGKIPWRRKWQPTPVFLPRESHGQRSLTGYSPRGHKESDTTERLHTHTHVQRQT